MKPVSGSSLFRKSSLALSCSAPLVYDAAASPSPAQPSFLSAPLPTPTSPSVALASPGAPLLSRLLASSRSRASSPIFLASRALHLIQFPGTHLWFCVSVVSFYVCLAPGGLRDEDGRATSGGADGRVSWTDGGRSVLYLPKSFTTECSGARRSRELFL